MLRTVSRCWRRTRGRNCWRRCSTAWTRRSAPSTPTVSSPTGTGRPSASSAGRPGTPSGGTASPAGPRDPPTRRARSSGCSPPWARRAAPGTKAQPLETTGYARSRAEPGAHRHEHRHRNRHRHGHGHGHTRGGPGVRRRRPEGPEPPPGRQPRDGTEGPGARADPGPAPSPRDFRGDLSPAHGRPTSAGGPAHRRRRGQGVGLRSPGRETRPGSVWEASSGWHGSTRTV